MGEHDQEAFKIVSRGGSGLVKSLRTFTNREDSMTKLISVKEFKQRFGLGHTFTFQLLKEGRIPSYKVGKRRLISEDGARAFFESCAPVALRS